MRRPIPIRLLALSFLSALLLVAASNPQQIVLADSTAAARLNGANLTRADIPSALPARYLADWNQSLRWHLSEGFPPTGAIALFPTPSTWQQYKGFILATLTVFVLQMTLIAVLIAQMRRRKQSERPLSEREEQFRIFTSAAAVLIWVSDADKLCSHSNRFWLDFTKSSLNFALGNSWNTEVHPNDVPRCMNIYTRSFDRREEFTLEYRLRRGEGEYRWVLETGVPRFNSEHSFAGYIGSCIDVTERKQAEQELEATEETTRQQVRRFPVAMVMDRGAVEGNVLFNEKFTALFGYAKKDLPDMDRWWRLAYPDENYRTEVKATWQARIDEAIKNRTDIDPMLAKVRCNDGSTREIRFYFSRVGETDVVSFVDLTERKQTEVNGIESLERFVHKDGMASGTQMAASLAHELAQPLAAILSNAQAAERFANRANPDLSEIRGALADITEDDRRARAVVENMRAMFQRHRIAPRDLDLNQVVNSVTRLVKNEAVSQGVEVRLMLVPTAVQVRGYESILQQVLLNLIGNGMDAMRQTPKNRRVLTVTTAVQSGANCGTVLVEDCGKGIAEGDKPKLFTPFFTTKSDGLGMGLSISRSLVESLGGRITLEDRSGPGAAFRVSLPLAAKGTAW